MRGHIPRRNGEHGGRIGTDERSGRRAKAPAAVKGLRADLGKMLVVLKGEQTGVSVLPSRLPPPAGRVGASRGRLRQRDGLERAQEVLLLAPSERVEPRNGSASARE